MSENGDIFFVGFDQEGEDQNKILLKIDKNRNKQWETNISSNYLHTRILSSSHQNKVAIIQSESIGGKIKRPHSKITSYDKEGAIISSSDFETSIHFFSNLKNDAIYFSSHGSFFIENFDSLKFDKKISFPIGSGKISMLQIKF